MGQSKHSEFKGLCEVVFGAPDGQKVLAYLKTSYVDCSAMADTSEMTFYRLGQKELVQNLIAFINERDVVQAAQTIDYSGEYHD